MDQIYLFYFVRFYFRQTNVQSADSCQVKFMDTTWFTLHGTETEEMMSHGCHVRVRVRGCRIGEINHFVKWEVSYLEEGNSTIYPATCNHASIK